jgi:hypothetical protein
MNSSLGCVYVAIDQTRFDRCKIGFSSRSGKVRLAEASNPDYVLHWEKRTPFARDLERLVHRVLSKARVERIWHASGGRSEWFSIDPDEAVRIVDTLEYAASRIALKPIGTEVCEFLVHANPSKTEFATFQEKWLEGHKSHIQEELRLRAEEFEQPTQERVPEWLRLVNNLSTPGSWNIDVVLEEAAKLYLVQCASENRQLASDLEPWVSMKARDFKLPRSILWRHNPEAFVEELEDILSSNEMPNEDFFCRWSYEGALEVARSKVKEEYHFQVSTCSEETKL